jgi:hypothetical protein
MINKVGCSKSLSTAYTYKADADPLANYVASGDPNWTCYNRIAMHEDCDTSFINDVIVLFTSYQSLQISFTSLQGDLATCMSDKASLEG